MVYQTSHDDISKSFRDLTAVEGKQSSEVIHVHDQPTTPIVVTTAVRMSAPDVESQEPASTTMINDNESTVPKTMEENKTMINDDDNAGMGMGIAIFVLLIIGTVSAFFLPYISSACYIAALVLASVLTCGCCCAKNYNLKPHVKKMATATLFTLILLFIVSTIAYVMVIQSVISLMDGYDETTGTFSDDTSVNGTMTWTLSIIGYVLFLLLICLALIFSGIFTWGRKCGAPRV